MQTERQLSDEQEAQRLEGLRRLARIIARHVLENPEYYEEAARKAAASEERDRKDGAA